MSNRISIRVVIGSVRPGSYTSKASALVVDELRKDPQVSVEVVDPAKLDLPFPGARSAVESTQRLQEQVRAAAGVVLATPEYHGSFSSVMKLVIENLGYPSALSGKPVALALPLPVSVANVRKVFDADGRCLDPAVERLVRGVATNLMNYMRRQRVPGHRARTHPPGRCGLRAGGTRPVHFRSGTAEVRPQR